MSIYRIIKRGVKGDYIFPPKEKYTNFNFRLRDIKRLDSKFLYTDKHISYLHVIT